MMCVGTTILLIALAVFGLLMWLAAQEDRRQ
jgi:hypothetical protein